MSFRKFVIATLSVNIFTFVIGLSNSILSTRVLGPEGKGIFAIYSSAVELFALLLGMGVPHAMLYFSAKDNFSRKQLFNSSFGFLFFSTFIFFCVVQLSFLTGWSTFFLPRPFDGPLYQFTIVGYFFCMSGGYIFVSIINGHKLFPKINFASAVSIVATFLLYFYVWYDYTQKSITYQPTTFYWIQLIVSFLILIMYIYYYKKNIAVKETTKEVFLNQSALGSIYRYGILYFVSNLIIFINSKMDYWFVNYFAGAKELGIYVLASNVGLLMILLPNAIGGIVYSFKAGPIDERLDSHTAKACRISFSGALALSIFLWIFSGFFIRVIYGAAFERSAFVLDILLIGIVPYCVFVVLRGYFAGAGELKLLIRATVAGLLVTILLDILLIKPFGIIGASIASVSAYGVCTGYLLVLFCQKSGLRIVEVLFIKGSDIKEAYISVRSMIK